MITKTYSTTTKEITRQQLWQLVANINNWPKWHSNTKFALLHGDFVTGAHFDFQPQHGPKVTIRLVEVRTPQYYKDLTKFPLAKMYGEHSYEDTPNGLKITITMSITGPLAWLWNKVVMQDIVKNLPNDVEAQMNAAKQI